MPRCYRCGESLLRWGRRLRSQGEICGRVPPISRRASSKKIPSDYSKAQSNREAYHRRLNGIAAGSGASIALACDVRVASEEAGLKQAFIGVGLVPDSGSSYFLTQNLGPGRALELIMTGRTVGAKEAETLGLVNMTVPVAELDEAVN